MDLLRHLLGWKPEEPIDIGLSSSPITPPGATRKASSSAGETSSRNQREVASAISQRSLSLSDDPSPSSSTTFTASPSPSASPKISEAAFSSEGLSGSTTNSRPTSEQKAQSDEFHMTLKLADAVIERNRQAALVEDRKVESFLQSNTYAMGFPKFVQDPFKISYEYTSENWGDVFSKGINSIARLVGDYLIQDKSLGVRDKANFEKEIADNLFADITKYSCASLKPDQSPIKDILKKFNISPINYPFSGYVSYVSGKLQIYIRHEKN